ncbi:amino acid ABC transporter permease [Alkalihalobacillus trypoxylicola]|uniref:Amino acid ABC transporter permease n=1 Tax=Alkalihalobacillus trypoxylicola TaxID=519424 RepID=A0A162CTB3_9BACI|nr:ABC transporter permease subunit [Alkalihalobacillus trypoxylicola]KYG26566.1 amino acid ABC transporter permease [Alkalihalobacillus trypoxylicola]
MANGKIEASVPLWRNRKFIRVFWQIVFLIVLFLVSAYFINNAIQGLNRAGLSFGFSFLSSTASFAISDIIIEYTPADSYFRALLAGFMNTMRVAFIGIILTTIIGVLVGVARLSSNWLVRVLSGAYVEIFRNTPVLVQIFFWYFAFFLTLPRIQEVESVFGVFYFSNRGFAFPWLEWNGSMVWLILLIGGVVLGLVGRTILLRKQIASGKRTYPLLSGMAIFVLACVIAGVVTGEGPWSVSVPSLEGVGFSGGNRINPEFAAILCGLVFYTATYIAEIVRGGILAVPKGQIEAASALGLNSGKVLRFVTFPQAIRMIIPPVTSQYLGLTKNSSLAIAVGYFEILAVGNTIMNQAGKVLEIIIIWMLVYLTLSLITSLIMNIFNHYTRIVER